MAPGLFEDLIGRRTGGDDADALGLAPRDGEVRIPDLPVEVEVGSLESPNVPIAGMRAREPLLRREVVDEGEIRPESIAGERVDRLNELPVESPSDLLIGLRRVGVTVAKHEGAAGDVSSQAFDDVLAPVGLVEEPFGNRIQVRMLDVEQNRSNFRPNRSPAGLSGLEHRTVAGLQLRRGERDLAGLPGALASLERDERHFGKSSAVPACCLRRSEACLSPAGSQTNGAPPRRASRFFPTVR